MASYLGLRTEKNLASVRSSVQTDPPDRSRTDGPTVSKLRVQPTAYVRRQYCISAYYYCYVLRTILASARRDRATSDGWEMGAKARGRGKQKEHRATLCSSTSNIDVNKTINNKYYK